jgi:enoyl-CoA hydratase
VTVHLKIDEGVAYLTLDRPAKAHAYNQALLNALETRLNALEVASVTALVVSSTGDGAFCGGADLNEMKDATPEDAENLRSQALFERLARLPIISIAAVHGAAIGGGFELAMACDLRVVGPNARFGLPETRLGLIPTAGGCTRLPRLIGISRAKEVILGARTLDSQTAIDWGLAHRFAQDCRAEAMNWAVEITKLDRQALAAAKRVLDADDLSPSLARERREEAILYARKAED